MLAANRIAPTWAGSAPNCAGQPEGDEPLDDEPAAERIEREQRRQPSHDPPRLVQAQAGRRAGDARDRRRGRDLDGPREQREHERHRHADDGVADDHDPERVRRHEPGVEGRLRDDARGERPARRRDRPDDLVAREQRGPAARVDELRERGLLDGEERPDLVAARAEHAQRRGDEQHRERGAAGEHDPGADHEQRPRNSVRRRPNRSARVVSRSEIAASPSSVSAEEQPDLGAVEADRLEVQHQDDREEAVAEHPQAPGREQQHDVAAGPVSVHPTIVPDVALRASGFGPHPATVRPRSRQELADALGVNDQTIGYLERGEYNPSLDLALRAAEYFGLPVEAIFSRRPFAPMSAQLYGSSST